MVGFPDMGGTDNTLLDSAPVVLGSTTTPGSLLGANTQTLSEANLPSHTHAVSITTGGQSVDHTHSINITSAGVSAGHTHSGTTSSNGAHVHAVSGGTVGGTEFLPTGIGGGALDLVASHSNIVIDSGGAHTHTIDTGGESADHTHIVSGTSGGTSANHTHLVSGTSGSTGSGSAHNNLSRAAVVTFYIKL